MKVGIIGSGHIVSSVHLPLLSCIDNVNIEFIADRTNPLKLANLYKTKSIKIENISNLPSCDIVLLAIPMSVKGKYIQEFAKRDCFIFTEKPFATNLEEHKNFLKLTDKITCNYMRNYYNTTRHAKNIISSEAFGKIQKISIVEGGIKGKTDLDKNSYQNDPSISGGFLKDSASHTFSQLHFLFDKISVQDANIIWENNFDIETNAILDVNYNDSSFYINYIGTQLKNIEPRTTLFFDNYNIQFNHLIPDSIFTISMLNSDKQFTLQQKSSFASTFSQAYYLKWMDFLEKVLSSSQIDSETETSIMTTKIINDIIQKGSKK
jgi:predicted dehydrogenase